MEIIIIKDIYIIILETERERERERELYARADL